MQAAGPEGTRTPSADVAEATGAAGATPVGERLRRSECLRRIAGTLASVGGWDHERGSGTVFWTEEMFEITGYPVGDPPPYAELLERFPTPDRQRLVDAMEACRATGTPYDLELPFTRADGQLIWVRAVGEATRDDHGQVVGLRGAMQDVTRQQTVVSELEGLARRIAVTMSSVTDAVFILDGSWRFAYLNPRAEALLQRSAASLLGRELWEEFPEAVGTVLEEAYRQAVAEQEPVTVEEYHYEPLDLWVEVRAFPAPDGLTVVFRDVADRRAAAAERDRLFAAERRAREQAQRARDVLAHKATHDALTGLYNRVEVVSRLGEVGPDGCTVLLIDLDGFKRVNEALGRDAGDELLLSVAHRVRDLTRRADLLARTGGDKFAVLLHGGDRAAADVLAERILEGLRTPVAAAGQRLYVTASIGLARAASGDDGEQALRDAEVALHGAKVGGPSSWSWYDPALDLDVKDRLATAAEVHDGLEDDQFTLHFQPNFDLAAGTVVGAEALARWQHPERGLVPPGLFIPIAEDTGLIEPLGDWALEAALRSARPWTREDPTFVVWVNVSVRQLRRTGLARTISQLLTATRTVPRQLGIEVTESALADDAEVISAELRAISELGVQIAIDDFGTGYSSLARLAHLPFDVIKIDQRFVAGLATAQGEATVRAIIGLAHALGARVVAEGVETATQLQVLRDARCDQVSGFHLAHPVPLDELAAACAAGVDLLAG